MRRTYYIFDGFQGVSFFNVCSTQHSWNLYVFQMSNLFEISFEQFRSQHHKHAANLLSFDAKMTVAQALQKLHKRGFRFFSFCFVFFFFFLFIGNLFSDPLQ